MIRTWKTLALAALLAAVSPLVALAGAGGAAENKDLGKKVDDLRTAIDTLTKKVDGLKLQVTTDKATLDDIRRRLRELEKTLEAVQPPPFSDRGKSLYPPAAGGATGAVGRVLLRNDYAADVTLILNGNATLRIPAFQTGEVAGVPAGMLRYQVFVDGWGPGAVISTTLPANNMVSLVVK